MKTIRIFLIFVFIFFIVSPKAFAQDEISHYTCGMHPSVKVSVDNYQKGDTKCPICFMPLTPVIKGGISQQSSLSENVISQVTVALGDLKLAGIQTEPVLRRHLSKEIRTVGTVAFDPKLAIAQDEFISAAKAFDKAKSGGVDEITERAEQLMASAWKKLRLLGLSDAQIEELKINKKVQTNLILPEKKMWIYGKIYEHDLPLVHQGSRVTVVSKSLPGKKLQGTVQSVNSVLEKRTRTVTFRALIDNSELLLKPEMYVDVSITTHYMSDEGDHMVLSIPKAALLDTGRRKIVWVDKGNGQFEGRNVQLGPEVTSDGNRYYPVIEGLAEGESVVTKGNFLIDSQSQISGVAASAYGGALGEDQPKGSPAGHVH